MVGKSGVLEQESGNISETRKDTEKVSMDWRAYRNSPTLFRTVPSQTHYGLDLLPQDWGFATPPKTAIAIAQEWVKLRTSNWVHLNKRPLKILEDMEHGCSRDCPIF